MDPSQKPRYEKLYSCIKSLQNPVVREVSQAGIEIIVSVRYCLKFGCWVPVKGSDCRYSGHQNIWF